MGLAKSYLGMSSRTSQSHGGRGAAWPPGIYGEASTRFQSNTEGVLEGVFQKETHLHQIQHVGVVPVVGIANRIVVIVALVGWTTVARLVRATALSLRERQFVLAAKAQGASAARIMAVHILPNLASPIIVATTLSVGNVILLESVLSFLGLGIQPPLPSWGNLLTNAQELIWDAPALAVYPGLAIFVTVIAFNFVGDGLQDALDPRSLERGRR